MVDRPRKRITHAQNFLIRPNVARRIIERSEVAAGDLVIEIGPGRGTLTRQLAGRCHQVIAIEKDPTLARRLGREIAQLGNVAIFEGDFLELPLPVTPYKVVANIPFNVTSAIVNRLTRALNPPEQTSLVIQREAAERFMGRPKQTLVSLLLQPWFELSLADRFRQQDFVPPPRVDVVLLRFSKRGPPLIGLDQTRIYRDFVVHGFTAWKPTIAAAYERVIPRPVLIRLAKEIGFDVGLKPSEVSFDCWLALFRAFIGGAHAAQLRQIMGAEERLRAQQERTER